MQEERNSFSSSSGGVKIRTSWTHRDPEAEHRSEEIEAGDAEADEEEDDKEEGMYVK